jgi:hypothetical protein
MQQELQKPCFIKQNEVGVIQGIAYEAVLDGHPVPEFGGREDRVAYLPPELGLESLDGGFKPILIKTVYGKEKVCRTARVSHERTGENDGRYPAGTLECTDDGFVLERRCLMDKL